MPIAIGPKAQSAAPLAHRQKVQSQNVWLGSPAKAAKVAKAGAKPAVPEAASFGSANGPEVQPPCPLPWGREADLPIGLPIAHAVPVANHPSAGAEFRL